MSVHNIRKEKMRPGDTYVGRRPHRIESVGEVDVESHGLDGYFGNPFVVSAGMSREEAIRRFELITRVRVDGDPEYRERVKALYGKRLFCWCAPLACHGDVLEKIAAELNEVAS